jgi:CRISPR-associated protein Csd1
MAERHPAKIRNAGDQAKIISSNDKIGFTFRGRFTTPRETCGVSFEVSQKAHLALQWLVERQAYRNGDQAFVAWEIGGKEIPDPLANTFVLFGLEEDDQEKKPSYEGDVGQAFGVRLSKFIAGHSTKLGATDRIVIMGLDSASKGRLAITYYRELTGTEFLARLQSWHDGCAWYQNYGKDQKNKNYIQFVGSPSPRDIAIAAYGSDKQYKKIVKAAVERLLPCIAEGVPLPRDIVDSVVGRASNRILALPVH